jgi:hypothetical protein
MTERNANLYPMGRFDQGVAHGVPGVIGFLGAACAKGLAPEGTRELLDQSLAWLFANMRPQDGGSRFTYFPPEIHEARSGWCYGDPGVSAALLKAGKAIGDSFCCELALSVARQDARRAFEKSGVVDNTLCHGAAGLGHIFNRLFQATGASELQGAAINWFERALAMRRPGQGAGGFLNWWPEVREWRAEAGFLVGSAGIGLALLSAIYPVDPLWDTPLVLPTVLHTTQPVERQPAAG